MRRFALLLFFVLSLPITACGGGESGRTPGLEFREEVGEPLDLDAPPPAELAQTPCGNPDWSKLPPEFESEQEVVVDPEPREMKIGDVEAAPDVEVDVEPPEVDRAEKESE